MTTANTTPDEMTQITEMISIDEDLDKFKAYLDAHSRCIFSAKFGNGKSYFINRFMEKHADDYLFIPIYPVNYQVMDNKDIFELIKRDILIKLLSSGEIEIDNIEFDSIFLYYHFFTSKSGEILSSLLNTIPAINIFGFELNIGNVVKQTENIKQKFKEWKEQINDTQDKFTEDFITQFSNRHGSIYEFDAISQLICEFIKQYKGKNPTKKVVLIIEDLDRIDPAHIFRILNVFSAHFDRYTPGLTEFETTDGDNKFCLDKIVSICDISNIETIYHHVYGEKTDFLGYISKFSNSRPYNYSLSDKLEDYIINHLLDKRLLNYPTICKKLVSKILTRMNNNQSLEYNLRLIITRIKNAQPLVIHKQLTSRYKVFMTINISSDSPFTYLLSILKNFDIPLNDIMDDDEQQEILAIVGKFWIYLPNLSNNIDITLDREILKMHYTNRDSHNMRYSNNTNEYFNLKFNNNELIELTRPRWDNLYEIGTEMIEHLPAIADAITTDFIALK